MAKKVVSLKVDPKFFDMIFEKERKKLEVKKGVKFSQPKFTEYLAKRNVRFEFPKVDKKFLPKETKKSRKIRSFLI